MRILQPEAAVGICVTSGPTTSLESSIRVESNSHHQPHTTVNMSVEIDTKSIAYAFRAIVDLGDPRPYIGVHFNFQDPALCCVTVERSPNGKKRSSPNHETVQASPKRHYSIEIRTSETGKFREGSEEQEGDAWTETQPELREPIRNLLDCHFHKYNPAKYPNCLREHLETIEDVKHHIETDHRRPEYCPVCHHQFVGQGASEAYRAHVIARECRAREGAMEIDGLHGDLMDRICEWEPVSTTSLEQQWEEIWRIVFPGVKVPSSPFVCDEER